MTSRHSDATPLSEGQKGSHGIVVPRHPPPDVISILRDFVNGIYGYEETGVWPDNYALRKWAEQGRDALAGIGRLASDPKGADSVSDGGSSSASGVSSPESAAASLSAGVKEQDFQKFFERIDAAIKRITSGQAAMRIPVDFTDPDVVLAECKLSIAALREQFTKANQLYSAAKDTIHDRDTTILALRERIKELETK